MRGRGCGRGLRGLRHFVDSFYQINLSFKSWVVRSSTFCIKVSRKVFLFGEKHVGQLNSSRISLIVSRSKITSASDTPFSGNVGSAGWVNFPVLWKFSQDVMNDHFSSFLLLWHATALCLSFYLSLHKFTCRSKRVTKHMYNMCLPYGKHTFPSCSPHV
jgi:hypothetical protein